MTGPSPDPTFQALRRQYFDALCKTLRLPVETSIETPQFSQVSATGGYVRVFFESERGLCAFAVGATSDTGPLCRVEELAQRFPRARLLAEGIQRLSLLEQGRFLEDRWPDLQVMFSPEHLAETRRWQRVAAAVCVKKISI